MEQANKRQKSNPTEAGGGGGGGGGSSTGATSVIIQLQSQGGEDTGPQLEVPLGIELKSLEEIVNKLLQNEQPNPYSFYVEDKELDKNLGESLEEMNYSTESVVRVRYQPLATFRVMPVTRCTDSLSGHTDAVLHVTFSPDGSTLASGGGDCLVRFWDTTTNTPRATCKGHRHHVLCTAWAPDGARFASADKIGEIRVWDPRKGVETCKPLKGHKSWVTSLAFEPFHRNPNCERLASASKDKTVRIWNVRTGRFEFSLSGHTDSVESVKWGGEGLIYTASRDRTVRVWAVEGKERGKLVRILQGHAHRVNALALSTDFACRTGPYNYKGIRPEDTEEAVALAKERFQQALAAGPERLVSGSDDFTLILWTPTIKKQPVKRMTGHQQPVNHMAFSPDGRYFASASFDKKVILWNAVTGEFLTKLHGHVGAVYMVCWSPDSRFLASASKDSTVKVWAAGTTSKGKAKYTLPGHADEVYALDWSPTGEKVATGSKDRLVKIWRH